MDAWIDEATVHPHPRGESHGDGRLDRRSDGSPPPAWGKHAVALRPGARGRFTPTRVGKACSESWPCLPPSVHPHPRGESKDNGAAVTSFDGSPPPAWGKQLKAGSQAAQKRFTPTRVGKAAPPPCVHCRTSVHPNPRGESRRVTPAPRLDVGSPPPAWGKLPDGYRGCPAPGFTPTRVGKARSRVA